MIVSSEVSLMWNRVKLPINIHMHELMIFKKSKNGKNRLTELGKENL